MLKKSNPISGKISNVYLWSKRIKIQFLLCTNILFFFFFSTRNSYDLMLNKSSMCHKSSLKLFTVRVFSEDLSFWRLYANYSWNEFCLWDNICLIVSINLRKLVYQKFTVNQYKIHVFQYLYNKRIEYCYSQKHSHSQRT